MIAEGNDNNNDENNSATNAAVAGKDSSGRGAMPFASLKRQFFHRKRACPLAHMDFDDISYRNPDLLKRFISERGRILPSRITSVSHRRQIWLARQIKIARFLGMLPYKAD